MKFRILLLLMLVIAELNNAAIACTTFIISGKITPDGKPLLFKNRDTDNMNNSLFFFNDGRYDYIGIVTGDSLWNKMVWGGYNSKGFAIINSAAYNNNTGDTTKLEDQEGVIMKLALQNCKTLQDFEKLLDTIRKPLGTNTNFGVIDANGGAAYYETGNYRYVKYDANDPSVAPDGYLIRTNHSLSGDIKDRKGICRFNTASLAMSEAAAKHQVTPKYLFDHFSRNLSHSLTKTNLWDNIPLDTTSDFRFFIDYIPRRITASAVMIVGAPNEKQAGNAVMWTILGFPLTSVAIPTWIEGGDKLPETATMKENLHSPLCDAALTLKGNCFPVPGEGQNYINLAVVINKQNTGYMQLLKPIEDTIFMRADQLIMALDKGNKSKCDIQDYYKWLDFYLNESFKKLFNIELLL
ncbi:MAG: carcinine hydrolase/isopenicillin-N N-acyltransferase family protein [Bacteroidales bacterium]|nr:carcinine hydrolase/isopenicillin-N N-acyltransferase family protein [Bacteroidales bacterium]